MSEKKNYNIDARYTDEIVTATDSGWFFMDVWEADSWQNAITGWVDHNKPVDEPYQVVSETPSEDGLSGVINISARWLHEWAIPPSPESWTLAVEATLVPENKLRVALRKLTRL